MVEIMKIFGKRKVVAETEAKLDAVQLTAEQVTQVAAGSLFAPIGTFLGSPNSGTQGTSKGHHTGNTENGFLNGFHPAGI